MRVISAFCALAGIIYMWNISTNERASGCAKDFHLHAVACEFQHSLLREFLVGFHHFHPRGKASVRDVFLSVEAEVRIDGEHQRASVGPAGL